MASVIFQKGFKYQLMKDYNLQINIASGGCITPFIMLNAHGLLTIKRGYSWDGASGPTIDTKNCIRGSLVHDALYQLLRHTLVDMKHRHYIDMLFKEICIEDGMFKWRAWVWYKMVRKFGRYTSRAEDQRETFTAP